jgi:putative tricarboxylic transport membrane protein
MSRIPAGQVGVAVGVAAVGAFLLIGSFGLPDEGGYAQVGPAVVPRVVGAGLLALGVLLLREAITGGFRGLDEAREQELATDWRAFGWVSAGILVYGLLVERAGFVFASTLLFALVARGFGSARWVSNALIGVVLAGAVFVLFNYGLGLTLPRGILPLPG